MCGICGVIYWDNANAGMAENEVTAMLDSLEHRGPDGRGMANRGAGTLGATRLAIRGLADGQQPVVDEATGVMAVCNGEIDNHRELKHWLGVHGREVSASTDIAVIPGLYLELGPECVEQLVGAFALAVWDPRDGRLLLARDRAGERPLHFAAGNGDVRFASQLSALVTGTTDQPLAARTVDVEAVRGYLSAGYFPAPTSPFKEIRKVAPGERIEIRAGGIIEPVQYWRWKTEPRTSNSSIPPQSPMQTAAHDIAKAKQAEGDMEEFDALFRRAVGMQSDVDVPYGVFLSGGVDSSLVAAVARKLRPELKIKAYTLHFSEESYDESGFAEQVANLLGLELLHVNVTADAFPTAIADLVAASGEPLADPAWVPTALLSRRAAQDVRIGLVGEGADELFGGYPTYIGAEVHGQYARLPEKVRNAIRWVVERWPASDKKVTLSFLMKRFVQGAGLDATARHLLWTSSISPAVLARLGVPLTELRRFEQNPVASGAEPLDRLQRIDLENSLAEGLLTKADRASMRFAIELRAPYLDQQVMEFAGRLPASERASGIKTKIFLKRFAKRYLPAAIVDRRKRGLSVPLARWLREPLYDWARKQLSSTALGAVGVRPEGALELLAEHRHRKADHSRALWTLLVLNEWLRWAAAQNAASSGTQSLAPMRSATA